MHTFFQKKNTRHIHINSEGFTLVELMVSLSIFSIVMVISVGTLLIMIDINAKAQAVYSSTSNLSFALDSMTREIRTGYHYYCYATDINATVNVPSITTTNNCTNGNLISIIREKDAKQLVYRLHGTAIEQNLKNTSTGVETGWQQITSDEVSIDKFELKVVGADTYYASGSDTAQPAVDLLIAGSISNGLNTTTDFSIQTHIVERRLDII